MNMEETFHQNNLTQKGTHRWFEFWRHSCWQCYHMWRFSSRTAVAPNVAIFGNFGGNLTNHLVTPIVDKIKIKQQFEITARCQILFKMCILCIRYIINYGTPLYWKKSIFVMNLKELWFVEQVISFKIRSNIHIALPAENHVDKNCFCHSMDAWGAQPSSNNLGRIILISLEKVKLEFFYQTLFTGQCGADRNVQ